MSRNVAEARTRLGSEQARAQAGPDADIRGQNGYVIYAPSGDEVLPAIPEATLLGSTSCLALGPTWNTFINPSAPKREAQGAPPDVPEPKLPITREASESE